VDPRVEQGVEMFFEHQPWVKVIEIRWVKVTLWIRGVREMRTVCEGRRGSSRSPEVPRVSLVNCTFSFSNRRTALKKRPRSITSKFNGFRSEPVKNDHAHRSRPQGDSGCSLPVTLSISRELGLDTLSCSARERLLRANRSVVVRQ
jgi:hypothetical protein